MSWKWWQRGLLYQVYPRSFMDGNGDGTGDLAGITSRLDYLQWLGVDGIWISPIFPSPMADFGYDITNYTDVDAVFGTLADFDELVAQSHARGMRVILDFVPNHTSDQHAWFVESRSSRDNPRRDWYLWRDAKPDGSAPNNWLSSFGGSAWTWDAATGQYYYHAYLREQPDLNWRNPQVQAAMSDVLRFWFDRGVDGFRIDALRQVMKDAQFRDNPPDPSWRQGEDPYHALLPLYSSDRPDLMDIVHRFRDIAEEYPDRLLIGELYLSIERLVAYYGVDGRGLHLPFNFHLILTPWTARSIGALTEAYEAALPAGAWPNWVLGNHDRSRIATRVGAAQARVAAMLLLTLRGTPTVYNGDEIGMHDVPIPADLVQDPFEKNVPGIGVGRDPERTPLQWDSGPNAGFSTHSPWLPLADDFRGRPPEFFDGNSATFTGLYFNLADEAFKFFAPLEMRDNPLWINITDLLQNGVGRYATRLFGDPNLQPHANEYFARLNTIEGIKSIDLHIEEVTGEDKTVDVVVEIFNRVNSGGTKLSKGDLALAKICAEWPQARDEMKTRLRKWERAGFHFRLEWMLRNINTILSGEALFSALKNLDTPTFQQGLQQTERAVDTLLNLIAARLGLDDSSVLGGPAAIPLMSRYLVQRGGQIPDFRERDKLLYWYIQHSCGVDTRGPPRRCLTRILR